MQQVRLACALTLVAACADTAPLPPSTSPPQHEPCATDADCGPELCARSHECAAPSDLRKVQVIWTVAGHTPDPQVCANATSDDFTVRFDTDPDPTTRLSVSFGPVACELGRFTVDALPTWYWIGGINSREAGMSVPLDDAGVAKVDIPF